MASHHRRSIPLALSILLGGLSIPDLFDEYFPVYLLAHGSPPNENGEYAVTVSLAYCYLVKLFREFLALCLLLFLCTSLSISPRPPLSAPPLPLNIAAFSLVFHIIVGCNVLPFKKSSAPRYPLHFLSPFCTSLPSAPSLPLPHLATT
jgi:hypothetical protein